MNSLLPPIDEECHVRLRLSAAAGRKGKEAIDSLEFEDISLLKFLKVPGRHSRLRDSITGRKLAREHPATSTFELFICFLIIPD